MHPIKRIALLSLLAVPFFIVCMEQPNFVHKERQEYPKGLGFMPVENVVTTLSSLPKEVNAALNAIFVPGTAKLLAPPPPEDTIIDNNWFVTFISGEDTRRKNRISSAGYDPYQTDYPACPVTDFKGPVIHHCTRAIIQHLLKESGSKKVKALPSWLYHLNYRPEELSDANYISIRSNIPAGFKAFKDLTLGEKKEFIRCNLPDFYEAIRYIHYAFPDEKNVYVNPEEDNTFMLPHAISPDNEGLGVSTKYGKAILGQDLNKAIHNARTGHQTFEKIVKTYGDESDLKKWQECHTSDPLFSKEEDTN